MEVRVTPSVNDEDAAAGFLGLSVEANLRRCGGGVDRTEKRDATFKVRPGETCRIPFDLPAFGVATLEVMAGR